MCQQATLEVLSLPWTVGFSQHTTDFFKMCLSWSAQMHISARTAAIPSCAAAQMLTLYFQLQGDKPRQTQIAGCKHTDLERGQTLSAHQGGCRWFPCVAPLSDRWEISSKKSVYSYFCLQRLLEISNMLPFKGPWLALLHFRTCYLHYIFSLI